MTEPVFRVAAHMSQDRMRALTAGELQRIPDKGGRRARAAGMYPILLYEKVPSTAAVALPSCWRFRTGWRGVLVLQRHVEVTSYSTYDPGTEQTFWIWRDATTEDLHLYLADLGTVR